MHDTNVEQASPSQGTPFEIVWEGETLSLLPECALWWPAKRTLWIADLHMGKAATYRALGQPVPSGTTLENLARISALIARYEPTQLIFLGDFLHAAQARTASVLAGLADWRERCAHVDCFLIRGNHDSRAGDPPASLSIEVVNEPWLVGPFAACHHPQIHATHHVIAGHLHPALWLRGTGQDRMRLPCFSVEPRCMILPAFGEFTGGYIVEAALNRKRYAVGGQGVWPLPSLTRDVSST
jgi:uncharacterized protein